MLNLLKNNRQSYCETIMSNLSEYSYRNKRYHIEFALAIGCCDKSVDFSKFISKKRITDKLIPLEDNLCCIILDCAPAKSAVKATSNLNAEFQSKHSDKQLFTGVVTSKDYDSDKHMVNSLLDVLEYSVSNNMHGLIVDTHQMGYSS